MNHRLFRSLVVFGAALTGGITTNACSGGVDSEAARDASADGDYGKISPNYGNISDYGKISPAPCPGGKSPPCDLPDAGADADASDASDASEGG